MRARERWTAAALCVAAAVAAAIGIWGIGGSPMIGVADNGDFLRVMRTAGFDYANGELSYTDKYFAYANFEYRNVPLTFGGYVSTHLLFLFAAKAANALMAPGGGAFHLAALGVVYFAAFAGAIVLIYTGLQARVAIRLAVSAMAIAVFSDTAYTAYYHSFYGEPVSLLGFLYAIGCGLHAERRLRQEPAKGPLRRWLWALFAAIVIFMGAKSQNFAVGLIFFGLLLVWAAYAGGTIRKLLLGLSAATLLLGLAFYAAAPQELKRINLYQTVFFGVLKHSDDVSADLRELGLPQELSPLAGTNYFQAGTWIPQNSPALNGWFYERVSHLDVAIYYFRHPGKLLDRMEWAAEHSTTLRPYYLGSYAKAAGRGPGQVNLEGAWWSEWKKAYVPRSLSFAAALAVAYAAAVAWQGLARQRGGSREVVEGSLRSRAPSALHTVPWIALIAYATPLIGDGDADLAKHLFLYHVAFDFMAVYTAGAAVGALAHAAALAAARALRGRTRGRAVS